MLFLMGWLVIWLTGACSSPLEKEQLLKTLKRIASPSPPELEEYVWDPEVTEAGVVDATPTLIFYEVQPGDTLWTIAQRFGMDMEMLRLVNELEDPNQLLTGQRLLISDQVTISGRLIPTPTPTPIPCWEGCPYPVPECKVRGVRARLDGTPMYLLPGDPIYDVVGVVEVWFCREEDAQRAGWLRWTPYGPIPQPSPR